MSYADRIMVRGMEFFAYHGLYAEEKAAGQRFVIDVELTLDTSQAGRQDTLGATVDYSRVFTEVRDVVTGSRYKLIERLAHAIAERLLAHQALQEVRVVVHKPEAPLPGTFQDVAVEIRRTRADMGMGGPA